MGADKEHVNVYPLGDLHIGSKNFSRYDFDVAMHTIEKDDNGVVILNGDLINNAIKTSVSDIYDERLKPEQTVDMLVRSLEKIKEKIIGVTTGNHEDRTYKLTGIDIMKNVCHRLGIVDKYHPVANVIFVSFGKSRGRKNVRNTFSIYHTHGTGGGKTMGGKVNKVEYMSKVIDCDLYVHSHTHSPFVFKQDYFNADCSNKGVNRKTRTFVNTNAYEDYGGYGQKHIYTPSTMRNIKVTLTADKRGNKIIKAEV